MANASIIEGIGNDVLFIFTAFSLTVCVVITYYARLAVRTITGPPWRENVPATQETPAGLSVPQRSGDVSASASSSTVNEHARNADGPDGTTSSTSAVPSTPDQHETREPTARRSSDGDRHGRASPGDTHSEGLRRRDENRQDPDARSGDAQITVRVKFMENDRNFTVPASMTIGQLKRKCFPAEMEQGRRVRLIYSGHLLQDDNASLSFYGVNDFSVIHTQISEASQQAQHQQVFTDEGDLDLSRMLVPLVTTILGFGWFGAVYYSHLFSAISTAILIIVTTLYAFLLFAMAS